jgi:hypothetical protein
MPVISGIKQLLFMTGGNLKKLFLTTPIRLIPNCPEKRISFSTGGKDLPGQAGEARR